MNKELLAKLKQEYAHLGLAESLLQSHADMLVASGIVTEENINTIVSLQKDYLEGLQKYNDTRVSEAVRKAGEKALKDAEEKAKKAADEAAEKARKEAEEKASKELPDSVKTLIEGMKKEAEDARKAAEETQKAKEEAWEKTLKLMRDEVAGFKKENEDLKKATAAKERQAAIVAKAKELGIPQYRIDEGFVIADDADEKTYSDYLANIAKNIRANTLPGARQLSTGDGDKATKEEVDAIAKNMVENL